jgi:hypothetical protein
VEPSLLYYYTTRRLCLDIVRVESVRLKLLEGSAGDLIQRWDQKQIATVF